MGVFFRVHDDTKTHKCVCLGMRVNNWEEERGGPDEKRQKRQRSEVKRETRDAGGKVPRAAERDESGQHVWDTFKCVRVCVTG